MALRLADLLASLSLVSDLGMGYEPEQAIESCLLACGLAHQLGLDAEDQRDVFYTALLLHVGCTAGAHEQAALAGGDDIALRGLGSRVVHGSQRDVFRGLILQIGQDKPSLARLRTIGRLLIRGERIASEANRATCEVASQMARRTGLSVSVQESLHQMFEHWDGGGLPGGLSGDDIALPIRVVQVAAQAALFNRLGGLELAREVIRDRSGDAFDPECCACFLEHGEEYLASLDAADCWQAVLAAEPRPHRLVTPDEFDQIARVFADAVDLMSPYLHGHSVGVARLAAAAARELGLEDSVILTVRLAGMLHDIGRVSVSNGVWEKPAALTTSEWEQVRLHPYHSERILARSPELAEIAALTGLHHERSDGSGYYRRLSARAIPVSGHLLATADVFQAMTQVRPHRPALSVEESADELKREVEAGRLDAGAVRAVLGAAGQRSGRARLAHPGGLTDREVEVLRLAAHGLTNREMAERLSISPKTVGHHIQHIYDKIGVSTRAAAALFAMEHDLLQ